MVYFFGFTTSSFSNKLTIPKFTNKGSYRDVRLFRIFISNGKWVISLITNEFNFYEDENFFHISNIDNYSILSLLTLEEAKNFDENELLNISKFTKTHPAFRANLKISLNGGGYSSYQHEYPFQMTKIKGGIVSSIFSILDLKAEKNYIVLRNIFFKPKNDFYSVFLLDKNSDKILKEFKVETNKSNILEIQKEYISPSVSLITNQFLGIPIYLNQYEDGMISIEHTHPPHSYILGPNKNEIIEKYKSNFFKIIHD